MPTLNFSYSRKVSKSGQFCRQRQALAPLRKPAASFGISEPALGNLWDVDEGQELPQVRLGWVLSLLHGPSVWSSCLLSLPSSSRAASAGGADLLPSSVSTGSCLAGAGPSPRFPQERPRGLLQSNYQNVLASARSPAIGPGHFCLDACRGGVGMAT